MVVETAIMCAHRCAGSKNASLLFLFPAKEQRQESRMIKCTADVLSEEQLADTLHEPDGRILCSVCCLLERLARDMAHVVALSWCTTGTVRQRLQSVHPFQPPC
jgi:hypothetical protein